MGRYQLEKQGTLLNLREVHVLVLDGKMNED